MTEFLTLTVFHKSTVVVTKTLQDLSVLGFFISAIIHQQPVAMLRGHLRFLNTNKKNLAKLMGIKDPIVLTLQIIES